MFVMRTIEGCTHSLGQLVGAKQAVSFHYSAFAMNPLRLYEIEPRTLFGQQTAYDPEPFTCALDRPVVLINPPAHFVAYVPGGVVLDQNPNLLACRLKLLAAPRKEAGGYGAHQAAVHQAQPHFLKLRQKQSITGDGLGVGIVFGERLLHQTQGFSGITPAVEGRPSQPAPPGLVQETHRPPRMSLGYTDQPVLAKLAFFSLVLRIWGSDPPLRP
jgi:hypothetical protein